MISTGGQRARGDEEASQLRQVVSPESKMDGKRYLIVGEDKNPKMPVAVAARNLSDAVFGYVDPPMPFIGRSTTSSRSLLDHRPGFSEMKKLPEGSKGPGTTVVDALKASKVGEGQQLVTSANNDLGNSYRIATTRVGGADTAVNEGTGEVR